MKASQPVASIESLALAPPPPTAGGGLADAGDEGGESRPVTVVVTREVRPGRQADYEAWLADLIEEASRLEGYLGTEVHRPGPGERTYTSVFRFASLQHLRAFEDSDLRRRALARVGDLVEGDAVWRKLTGLEVWFTPPPGTVVPQPSRFRMALLLTVVVYGLVLSIGRLVALVLDDTAVPLRLFVTIVIEVFLMTYVVMPHLTRWLARFLYPAPASSSWA